MEEAVASSSMQTPVSHGHDVVDMYPHASSTWQLQSLLDEMQGKQTKPSTRMRWAAKQNGSFHMRAESVFLSGTLADQPCRHVLAVAVAWQTSP
jgi:hypothetical protein